MLHDLRLSFTAQIEAAAAELTQAEEKGARTEEQEGKDEVETDGVSEWDAAKTLDDRLLTDIEEAEAGLSLLTQAPRDGQEMNPL